MERKINKSEAEVMTEGGDNKERKRGEVELELREVAASLIVLFVSEDELICAVHSLAAEMVCVFANTNAPKMQHRLQHKVDLHVR